MARRKAAPERRACVTLALKSHFTGMGDRPLRLSAPACELSSWPKQTQKLPVRPPRSAPQRTSDMPGMPRSARCVVSRLASPAELSRVSAPPDRRASHGLRLREPRSDMIAGARHLSSLITTCLPMTPSRALPRAYPIGDSPWVFDAVDTGQSVVPGLLKIGNSRSSFSTTSARQSACVKSSSPAGTLTDVQPRLGSPPGPPKLRC